MADSRTRILCTGDIHMGRIPSALPEDVDLRRQSTIGAWGRIVDAATENRVHALILTGDVIDRENRSYESIGPLEAGLRRLAEAGIRALAVAGNHDFDVLPELADTLEPGLLTVLGRGGNWSEELLDPDGEGAARLVLCGWSFPAQHVPRSPLSDLPEIRSDLPVIGVMHADLDAGQSGYAPVARAELSGQGVGTWLLGHLHKPSYDSTDTGEMYLYPGSPQPLDPGETGPHGPWLLEIGPEGQVEARMLPLASVRYDSVEVSMEDAGSEPEVMRRLWDAIDSAREDMDVSDRVEHLVLRAVLTGRTPLHRRLPRIAADASDDLRMGSGDASVSLDRLLFETRPAHDLQRLAERETPVGILARWIMALEGGGQTPEVHGLLEAVEEKIGELSGSRVSVPVRERLGGLDIVDLARRQALLLLDELQSQIGGE